MEGTLATILLFASNFAPKYWAFCQGQSMSIAENSALFALLGTQYGGDGQTTFCLPNLTHDNPGLHYIICVQGNWPNRD